MKLLYIEHYAGFLSMCMAADGVDSIIGKLHDMEHVNADMRVGKHLLGDGNKTVVHSATKVVDTLTSLLPIDIYKHITNPACVANQG